MRTLPLFFCPLFFCSCSTAPSADGHDSGGLFSSISSDGDVPSQREYKEGKDYTVWQRARIVDQNGFGRPVEAMSYLVPKGWKVEGGIQWTMDMCTANAMRNRSTLSAPDGWFKLELFPNIAYEHTDDPGILQLGSPTGPGNCPLAGLFSPEDFMGQVFSSQLMPGTKVVSVGRNAEAERVLTAQLQQQMAGTGFDIELMAIEAELDHGAGEIGQYVALVYRTKFQSLGIWGGVANMGNSVVAMQHASRYPKARKAEGEQHFATIFGSMRMNPEWDQAVQNVSRQATRDAIAASKERSRINFETSREISEMSMRSWEKRMESNERGTEQFSQAIRGVETWQSPDGDRLELSSGYNDAWSRGDGTYILSNDPLFDPNRAFQENWDRMQRPAR
jgi:hypothetical protein